MTLIGKIASNAKIAKDHRNWKSKPLKLGGTEEAQESPENLEGGSGGMAQIFEGTEILLHPAIE
jgi:hypothetical protein